MSIDVSRIKRFKNFMKFFEVSKANISFGIASKHKVPSIDNSSDVLSKTSTIMSRIMNSGKIFVSGFRNHPFLGQIQCENVVTKKRTPSNLNLELDSAFPTAMNYKIDTIFSCDIFNNIKDINIVECNKEDAIIKMQIASFDRWSSRLDVFGYNKNILSNENNVRIFKFNSGKLTKVYQNFSVFCTRTNSNIRFDNNEIPANEFGTLTIGQINHIRNRANDNWQAVQFELDQNFMHMASSKIAGVLYSYSISNSVVNISTTLEKFEEKLSSNISKDEILNLLVDRYNYPHRFSRGENIFIHIVNINFRDVNGDSKCESYILTNSENRNLILTLSFSFNFMQNAFESSENITSAINLAKVSFESHCNAIFGPLIVDNLEEKETENV